MWRYGCLSRGRVVWVCDGWGRCCMGVELSELVIVRFLLFLFSSFSFFMFFSPRCFGESVWLIGLSHRLYPQKLHGIGGVLVVAGVSYDYDCMTGFF